MTLEKACGKLGKRSHVERYPMPEENQNQSNPIEAVIERIAAMQGVETMPLENQAQLKGQIRKVVEDRVEDVMLNALPDAKLMELSQRLDGEMSDQELEQFFANAGVDYKPLLEQALNDLEAAFRGSRNGEGA